MYDELITKIRHCATDPMHCLSCGEDKDGRCFARLMTQAANAIEELAAKYNKAITDIVNHEKPREWNKRMEVNDYPGVTWYTPVWSCPCCGLDYDPAAARMINYCYLCGVKMGEGQDDGQT